MKTSHPNQRSHEFLRQLQAFEHELQHAIHRIDRPQRLLQRQPSPFPRLLLPESKGPQAGPPKRESKHQGKNSASDRHRTLDNNL